LSSRAHVVEEASNVCSRSSYNVKGTTKGFKRVLDKLPNAASVINASANSGTACTDKGSGQATFISSNNSANADIRNVSDSRIADDSANNVTDVCDASCRIHASIESATKASA
jgi:hypothetical protein